MAGGEGLSLKPCATKGMGFSLKPCTEAAEAATGEEGALKRKAPTGGDLRPVKTKLKGEDCCSKGDEEEAAIKEEAGLSEVTDAYVESDEVMDDDEDDDDDEELDINGEEFKKLFAEVKARYEARIKEYTRELNLKFKDYSVVDPLDAEEEEHGTKDGGMELR